jgi:tetratricopeptide (TPR) repeat protein
MVGPDEDSISTEGASIAGVGFWLLDPEEAKAVQTQEANLRSQSLNADAKDLLVAELYLSRGLKAEAIELLESIETRENTPWVGLLLGQIYLDLGMLGEAEVAFSRSSEFAALNGDLQAEAESHIGLGIIASAKDNPTLANQHYDAAKELYTRMGSEQGIQQVEALKNE